MNEITIPLRYLQAARIFAAKGDTRSYLNGVAIKDGYVVGTNGHYAGALRCEATDGHPEVIIPNTAIDLYSKAVKGGAGEHVAIQWDSETRQGHIVNRDVIEIRFEAFEGRYPDFMRILPAHAEPKGNPQFQWSYLVLFEKAAEALGISKRADHKVFVLPDGDEGTAAVVIPGHPQFKGAICPLRTKATAESRNQIAAGALV